MTTLPHSAAHAVVYSLSKTMADLLHGVLGCLKSFWRAVEATFPKPGDSHRASPG